MQTNGHLLTLTYPSGPHPSGSRALWSAFRSKEALTRSLICTPNTFQEHSLALLATLRTMFSNHLQAEVLGPHLCGSPVLIELFPVTACKGAAMESLCEAGQGREHLQG